MEHVLREAIALLKMADEELRRLSEPDDADAEEVIRRVGEFLRAYGRKEQEGS